MRNAEIAAHIRELGVLYELDGADRFRVLAYKEAAKTIQDSPVSIEQLSEDGRLTELPNVGKTLATKIEALLETGEIPSAEKLKAKFPASLVSVTRVPGLGAKKVRRLYDELGVTDLDSLRAAAEQEQIREMKGFGAKVEERVLAELENLPDEGDASERRILSKVLPVAYELKEAIEAHPASGKVAVTGSARRWGETCKDIDLIATSDDPRGLGKALAEHELVAQASSAGDKGTSVLTHTGVKVDLRITPEETFGNLLQHFTGSMEHNVQLRERALKRGMSVSRARRDGNRARRNGKIEEEAEGPPLRGRGRRLRAPRPRLHRARAAPGPRRDRGRRGGQRFPSSSPSRTSRATCTATPRSRTGATRSTRWRRRHESAATATWRSPTTLRATGSATTSRRRRSPSESRRSRSGTRRRGPQECGASGFSRARR